MANKLRSYVLQAETSRMMSVHVWIVSAECEDGPEQLSEETANIRLGFAPDLRNYRVAIAALEHLDVKRVVVYTDNLRKIEGSFQSAALS